jgi:hypothetical protein
VAVAAAAVVALGGLAYFWYPRAAPPPATVAFTIDAPEGQTMAAGPASLSVSPDGTRVAFVTGGSDAYQLWVRTLGSLESRRFERADGAWNPVWSPDGRSIAFGGLAGTAPLRKVDVETGIPTTLAPAASGRAAWGAAGVILFSSGNRLYQVSDAGGSPPTVAMELDDSRQETTLTWPTFLPDGRRYLFVARTPDAAKSGLFLATLGAPGRTFVLSVHSSVDYAAGHLFYQREQADPFPFAPGWKRLASQAPLRPEKANRFHPGAPSFRSSSVARK